MKTVSSWTGGKSPSNFLENLIRVPSLFYFIFSTNFSTLHLVCLEISRHRNSLSLCLLNKTLIKPFFTIDIKVCHLSPAQHYPTSPDIGLVSYNHVALLFWFMISGIESTSLTFLILANWLSIKVEKSRDHSMRSLWALLLPNQCIKGKNIHFKIDRL